MLNLLWMLLKIKIFNVIDTTLNLGKNTFLSYEEIIHHLANFMHIEEPNNLEFRA